MKKFIILLSSFLIMFMTFLSPQIYAQAHSKTELEAFNEVKDYISFSIPGFTLLNHTENPIKARRIKISQVLSTDCKIALAYANPRSSDFFALDGTQVLLLGFNDQQFYDDQIMKIPKKHKLIPVGRYRYTTVKGAVRTVPAVVLTEIPSNNKKE